MIKLLNLLKLLKQGLCLTGVYHKEQLMVPEICRRVYDKPTKYVEEYIRKVNKSVIQYKQSNINIINESSNLNLRNSNDETH